MAFYYFLKGFLHYSDPVQAGLSSAPCPAPRTEKKFLPSFIYSLIIPALV